MAFSRNFHMTIKPIGAACNMNCKYCYFLSKINLLNSFSRMSDETLENFIKSYIQAQDSDVVFFTWHGGEPTLLEIDFFRKVIEFQKKYSNGKYIENDLQTNGLLIDDTWCKFLKENNFLIGLSVDGDENGNSYRQDNNGNSVLKKTIEVAKLLKKYNIPFNTLTVINNKNSKRPVETYEFLKNIIGSNYMQFIPAVEIKDHENTAPGFWKEKIELEEYSVSPEDWGNFLTEVFNNWYENDKGKVFIFLFENFLSLYLNRGPQMCFFEKECSHAMAIDRDGSVYACDHFVYPEYNYGNINDLNLNEIALSEKRKNFAKLKSNLHEQCLNCEWLNLCNGECPKKRFLKTSDKNVGLNYLCEGYKIFFAKTKKRMLNLSKLYDNV